jgi:acyl phosphate:glycerol-3-phosphate acyltransferase
MANIIGLIGAYLVGSIPTGYLIARWAGIADIRKHGSGNIGATNVARALGVHFFFIVFFIDALKAYCYLRSMQGMTPDFFMHDLIAIALLLGNIFSCFLEFRGGKGVATSIGIGAALMPTLLCYVFGIWLAILAITKTVGIASVVGAVALPILAWYHYGIAHAYALLSITIAVMLLITHRENLARFLRSFSF